MFCQNCGSPVTGNFCSNCGAKVSNPTPSPGATPQATPVQNVFEEVVLWEGQPAGIGGKLKSAAKVNSVKYKITNQRVIISSGLIGKKEDEIELSRIKDYKVTQSIAERLQNIGDITIISTDISTPTVVLENVENPTAVKEILRKAVMEYRQRMNINYRENL